MDDAAAWLPEADPILSSSAGQEIVDLLVSFLGRYHREEIHRKLANDIRNTPMFTKCLHTGTHVLHLDNTIMYCWQIAQHDVDVHCEL